MNFLQPYASSFDINTIYFVDSFFFLLISPFVGNVYTFSWSRVDTGVFDFRCTTVDSAITYITKCSYSKFTFALPLTSPVFLLLNIIAYTETQALFYLFINFSSITERVNFLHLLKYYLLLWSSKLSSKISYNSNILRKFPDFASLSQFNFLVVSLLPCKE